MSNLESNALRQDLEEHAFATTRWSLVLAAKDVESPESGEALEALCRQYWYPLYAFVRSLGHPPHDAQDLTQEFFARLLAREYLRLVLPEKGRFRTFLRMALRRFLSNERERAATQKRGGGISFLPFNSDSAEEQFARESSSNPSPDVAYDQRWAIALLNDAITRLEQEYRSPDKEEELKALRPHLTTKRGSIPYDKIATRLNTNEGAARVLVHRMRRRFRDLFRAAVADTVSTPDQVEAEFQHVLEALRGA